MLSNADIFRSSADTDILGGRLANCVGAGNKAVTPAPAGSAKVRALH
jgi:hypothetical protein